MAEQAAMGNWTKIGYTMKNGDSFRYADTDASYTSNNTTLVATLGNDGKVGWTATSNVKLNDCAKDATWKIFVYSASGNAEGMVGYKTKIKGSVCRDLTPSFEKLATKDGDATLE